MSAPRNPLEKKPGPDPGNPGSHFTFSDGDKSVEERLEALQHELEVLRGQNVLLVEREAVLRERESHLSQALEAAGVGMWIRDPDGGWKINRVLNVLFGRSPEVLLIKDEEIPALIHPDDQLDLQNALNGAIHGCSGFEAEYRVTWPDGSVHWVASKGRILPENGVPRFLGVTYDITERKRIEDAIHESEERYRTVVEMSPDAIIIHQQGKIVFVNPTAVQLFGAVDLDDLIGRPIIDLVHPDFQTTVQKNIHDDLLGLETPPVEVGMIRLDGTLAAFEGKGKRIIYNRKPAVQVMIRDITERRKAENLLKEYAGQLERSNEDLELFVTIAAHDLQEPIRGIVTYSQLLLSQYGEGMSPKTEKYLKVIEGSGLRMNVLVNNLREYSRVQIRAKPSEPVDMGIALSSALNNLQLMIRETRTSIKHDQLPVVRADPTQMTQVFQNILENAMKFRKDRIPPEVHISAIALDGMWQFAIQDNGIGIPKEYTDKIFILFERLHDKEVYPGTGLGLALCKRIIERHGGRMWVESEVGTGSTFFFTVPAVTSSDQG